MIRRARVGISWLALAALAGPGPSGTALADEQSLKENLRFASEMAEQNNWREAGYRWQLALEEWPTNPRILSNLAVSREALGDFEAARNYYTEALELSRGEPRIIDNARRFNLFLRQQAELAKDDEDRLGEIPEELPLVREVTAGRKKGKAVQVSVGLPVPPRLDVPSGASLLVASFLTDDTEFLDTNRELVRFLRSEFRKRTDLDVLQVVPPPAVPEQTLEDLIANAEFWKYLAREYGADLIVSGMMGYGREDASGFRDVDTVSRRTGQKVRQLRFVDQEEFSYGMDLLFFDGASGELLHRDRLRRSLLFAGSQNDPIAAFYELSESIASDVLSVVTARVRRDTRAIFRK